MRNAIVGVLTALLVATPAAAQSLTPYAGYVWFGDLAEIPDFTDLSTKDNWIVGAQVGLRLGSTFALFGNVAHTRTDLRFVDESAGFEVPASGELGYWLYDAGIELSFPIGLGVGSLAPFLQAGGGAVRYTAERDNFGSDSRTDVQFNFGGGLDVRAGGIGLRLMLKDYVTSLDWRDFEAFRDQVQDAGIDSKRTAHNLALTAGLRLGF